MLQKPSDLQKPPKLRGLGVLTEPEASADGEASADPKTQTALSLQKPCRSLWLLLEGLLQIRKRRLAFWNSAEAEWVCRSLTEASAEGLLRKRRLALQCV